VGKHELELLVNRKNKLGIVLTELSVVQHAKGDLKWNGGS
jgi:hypothetical protein